MAIGISKHGLAPLIDQVEVKAHLATMDHLIGCASRHKEASVERKLIQTMDDYTRSSDLV
jgi:hypothetical protein